MPKELATPEEIVIIGGGAAGLAAAVFAAGRTRETILLLDGTHRLGAKILISGGGRCNLTNVTVRAEDFHGGEPKAIRRVLRALTQERTLAFFASIGVPAHAEEDGKIFPDSGRATTVRDALVRKARDAGVRLLTGHRVQGIAHQDGAFRIVTHGQTFHAAKVILATGGLSIPGTGSDGSGYEFASGFGHTIVPTTPALVGLILEGRFHRLLQGISHQARLSLEVEGTKTVHLRGPLLWTHFGISGPVVLDISRLWHRARLSGRDPKLHASFLPDDDFTSAETRLLEMARRHPRMRLDRVLASILPARMVDAVVQERGLDGSTQGSHFRREERRRLVHALLGWPLPVRDSRGYQYAEVTAGGIPLDEVDLATMESKLLPGLHFAGEILDVDGRLGGFNFQWAWSSAWVAAIGCAATPNLASF